MKLKNALIALATLLFTPLAFAECTNNLSSKELVNCHLFLEAGQSYSQWKSDFTNPPQKQKDTSSTTNIHYDLAIIQSYRRN